MRDADCVGFLQWALPRMRLRWAGFRKVRRQVCRRIAERLRRLELPDLSSYRRLLERDEREWVVLDALCRVTISRFYRDRGVFEALGAVVLPELVSRARSEGRGRLRAWSAGCASGEEPYSLALLWRLGPAAGSHGRAHDHELTIVATDRDPHLVERARRASYPEACLRELPTDWRRLAFESVEGCRRLRAEYRTGVSLAVADLRLAPVRGPLDLVLCRNLAFTYFAPDLQSEVLTYLASVLRPRGVLVIGAHESLPVGSGFRQLEGARGCYGPEA